MAQSATDDELEVDEESDDEEVSIAYDIASYPSDLTLSVVYEMWKAKSIKIPEFQRNFVWDIKQASLLIDSFLAGLPVPQVFFYINEENVAEVIDGQQRIMSVVYFLEGYFGSESLQGKRQVFRLQGLDEKKNPYAKKRFVDLSESLQRKLTNSILRAINIRQLNPKGQPTSIYHIFERLNTGGTPLKPQEIRNCVFRGNFISILRQLNVVKSWREIIGKKTLDKHQKDVELILRVFSLTCYFGDYEKPMKEFLSKVMSNEKAGASQIVTKFKVRFEETAKLIGDRLGPKPFHLRGRLNSSALDAVFSTLLAAPNKLHPNLEVQYEALKNDPEFVETTFYSTSDVSVVKRRFDLTRKYLLK